MTDLASLVVKLEAQTAQYMAGMERAEKRLKRFDKASSVSAASIGRGLATAATGGAVAFAAMSKAAIDSADRFSKMSQSTGITTESLSQLDHAVGLSGSSIEGLSKGVVRLSRNAVDAARGLEAPARAFDALGISATNADGSLKDTESLLLEVADRFAQLEDGAGKAAIAQELFGKSGVELIPFLNQGRAGIEALKKEADDFGLTVSTKAGKAAEEFNDNLTRVGAASKGLTNQFVEEALPTLTAMSERFAASAKNGGALELGVKSLAVSFQTLVSAGVIVTSIFEQLGQIIYGVGAAVVRIAQGEFRLAGAEITDAFGKARANVTDDIETIAKIWSDSVPVMEEAAGKMDDALKDTLVFGDEKAAAAAKKATESALDSIRSLAAGVQQQVDTYGMAEAAVIRYRVAQGDLAATLATAGEAAQPYIDQLITQTEKLDALKTATEAAAEAERMANAQREEGVRITESLRTPAEQYAATVDNLNKRLADNTITQETFNRGVERASEAFDKATQGGESFRQKAVDNIQDSIADALVNGVEDGGKGALRSFLNLLLQMQAQAIAADITKAIFGGGTGGTTGGDAGWFQLALNVIAGGSRDSGGRGEAGMAYTIGTGAQPETFVPDRPGTFMTAAQMQPNVEVRPQIINVKDPSEIPTAIQSGDGEAAVLNVIGRNPSVIKTLLQG